MKNVFFCVKDINLLHLKDKVFGGEAFDQIIDERSLLWFLVRFTRQQLFCFSFDLKDIMGILYFSCLDESYIGV